MSHAIIAEIRDKLIVLEAELAAGETAPSKEKQIEIAKESYSGLAESRKHFQDLAGRILTAVAFFTAAAAALFKSAYDHLNGSETALWPTFFFSLYLLGVLIGALFLLATMWPAVWNAILKPLPNGARGSQKEIEEFTHTFSHPKNARSIDDDGAGFPATSYQDDLIRLYWRERTSVLDDSKGITELLRCGGISLMAAFFAFVQLAATLFFEPHCTQWSANALGTAALAAAMTGANYIRHKYTSSRFLPRPDPWWKRWRAITVVLLVLTVLLIAMERRCEPPVTDRKAAAVAPGVTRTVL